MHWRVLEAVFTGSNGVSISLPATQTLLWRNMRVVLKESFLHPPVRGGEQQQIKQLSN